LDNIEKKKKEEMENQFTKEELERMNKYKLKNIFGFGRKKENENNNSEN